MNRNKFIAAFFLISVSGANYAQSQDEVRHLILNNTQDYVQYDLKNTADHPCHITGTLQPGAFKDISCEYVKSDASANYVLDFTAFYNGWFGSKKIRCIGNKAQTIKKNKQIVWSINEACLVDTKEA